MCIRDSCYCVCIYLHLFVCIFLRLISSNPSITLLLYWGTLCLVLLCLISCRYSNHSVYLTAPLHNGHLCTLLELFWIHRKRQHCPILILPCWFFTDSLRLHSFRFRLSFVLGLSFDLAIKSHTRLTWRNQIRHHRLQPVAGLYPRIRARHTQSLHEMLTTPLHITLLAIRTSPCLTPVQTWTTICLTPVSIMPALLPRCV